MKIEIITNADNNPVAEFFSSSNTPETNEAQHEGLLRGNPMPTQVVHVNFARKLERERDEARAVAGAMADIAFKHLTSLLASTPQSKDAADNEETQQVIAEIKRWKEMRK